MLWQVQVSAWLAWVLGFWVFPQRGFWLIRVPGRGSFMYVAGFGV